MTSRTKEIIKQRKESLRQDQMKVYSELFSLVEQALHARVVADVMWKYRWKRVARTGIGNYVVSFSQVALENFAVQQLWKLFDRTNSIFHVWYVAEHLPHLPLLKWLEDAILNIQSDMDLISEWRHTMVAHRGEVAHFASSEYEKKFNEGRISEKRLHDLLFKFLCQIKFELNGIPVEKTMEELQLQFVAFESHAERCMIEIFTDFNDEGVRK